jgi:hypothetical protein
VLKSRKAISLKWQVPLNGRPRLNHPRLNFHGSPFGWFGLTIVAAT